MQTSIQGGMPDLQRCTELVRAVPDPEIPVVTIADLGILRSVSERADGTIEVRITPTYSGCPAMLVIRDLISRTLIEAGVRDVVVSLVLSPAWTTDWITDAGRQKMKDYGIAPPAVRSETSAAVNKANVTFVRKPEVQAGSLQQTLFSAPEVACPRCDSANTQRISAFGSTACQEQWRCLACREPFDHFKCH